MKKYLFLLLLSVLMLPAKAQMDSMSVDSDSVATLPWPQTLQADIDTLIELYIVRSRFAYNGL